MHMQLQVVTVYVRNGSQFLIRLKHLVYKSRGASLLIPHTLPRETLADHRAQMWAPVN
jgi:hypothetical protein